MRAPNKKNLKTYFGDQITDAEIKEIINLIESKLNVDKTMDGIDKVLKGYGVEAIRSSEYNDSYYRDTVAVYINTGNTYSPTIVFDTVATKFYVTTFGDFVEAKTEEYKIS